MVEAVQVAGLSDELAAHLGRVQSGVARELVVGDVEGPVRPAAGGYSLWVREHLDHVKRNLSDLQAAAGDVAQVAARPWWR